MPFPGTINTANRYAAGGVVQGLSNDAALKAALREAVAGVQPVVSVKEIAKVSNRVKIKEQSL